MFRRWGAFVYRFRRPIVVLSILLAVAASTLAAQASGSLSSGGWLDADSESAQVGDRLAAEFGTGQSSIIVVVRASAAGVDARTPEFQAAMAATIGGLADEPLVTGVFGFAETGDERFISAAGDAAYVVVGLDLSDEASVEIVDELRAAVTPPPGYEAGMTGYGPLTADAAKLSEEDLQRAEVVSLPIAALVLVVVFASLVAAGMPLLVAGLAIPSSLALVYIVAQYVEMSVFVLNIATMLGLALAIDYSLFVVSRFREELQRGRTVADAVERTVRHRARRWRSVALRSPWDCPGCSCSRRRPCAPSASAVPLSCSPP